MLLAVALALAGAAALAEVGKGDSGEEVRYLQWLLQRTGWLDDKPDGAFGGHTEQAVMDYQASLGLEATGVADDVLMQKLDQARVAKDKREHGADYYEPYPGAYVPAFETGSALPLHCTATALGDAVSRRFCARHAAVLDREYALTLSGEADDFAEASALWLGEIEAMFSEWAKERSGEEQAQVQALWTAWGDFFSTQYKALSLYYGDDSAACERQQLLMLKQFAGSLCEIRSGELPATLDKGAVLRAASIEPDESELMGPVETAANCRLWSVDRDTEFLACCDKHAKLARYELKYSKQGEEGFYPRLKGLADKWDKQLKSLYVNWRKNCERKKAAKAVKNARAAFKAALDLQDALLDGDGIAPLARLRVCQFEAARLCELVNGDAT